MSQKLTKDRSTNFSKEEVEKLMAILKEYPIIINKKTDHASCQQKEAAWSQLTDTFNETSDLYRSKKQLQYKFNNMKKVARMEMSAEKRARRQTGGGPPLAKPSSSSEWLKSVMKESITGLASVYDSDTNELISMEGSITNDTNTVSNLSDIKETVVTEPDDNNLDNSVLISLPQLVNTDDDGATSTHLDDKIPEYFDTSTPKSMLRKHISKELRVNSVKKKIRFTSQEIRKCIVNHLNNKQEIMTKKSVKMAALSRYLQEEHELNVKYKEAQIEQLKMETAYKEKIYKINLKKAEIELRIEEAKLEKMIENYKEN